MKIICNKSNLLNGASIVSKAVPSKTTMPILECILIDASKDIIKLTANDMDLGIDTVIEGEIADPGIIALEAKLFLEIVRKLPDNDVIIETDQGLNTFITCEKANFHIVGKPADDFAYLPQIERNNPIVISQFSLKEIIRQTIFSISDNDSNKMMGGELFEINENHPIATKLEELYKNDKEQLTKYTKILYAEARLIEGLPVENQTEISSLICDILSL